MPPASQQGGSHDRLGKRFSVRVEEGIEIVDTRGAVAIVAVDADDRIVLVRQNRPAVGAHVLELPAGLIAEAEEPLEAARRELREETGLYGGAWRELASTWSSPGFASHRVTVFLAEALDQGEPEPDEGEELELVRWTPHEAVARLDELDDAKTLIGFLLYLRDAGKVAQPCASASPRRSSSRNTGLR